MITGAQQGQPGASVRFIGTAETPPDWLRKSTHFSICSSILPYSGIALLADVPVFEWHATRLTISVTAAAVFSK